jgi:hypothetical protein
MNITLDMEQMVGEIAMAALEGDGSTEYLPDITRSQAVGLILDALDIPWALSIKSLHQSIDNPDNRRCEDRVLAAVANWRTKPNSSGALTRLMAEAAAWLDNKEATE